MKKFIKFVINIINKLLLLRHKNIVAINSAYLVRMRVQNENFADMTGSDISKSFFEIHGNLNFVKINNSIVENCNISIQGENNSLVICNNVKLRSVTINMRGNNCHIEIGKNSSFGGARIVNVGDDNDIAIGEDCLFADNIEIWASDTHKIYDSDNNCINPEKPITIGDEVWIGSYVKILKGVKIGNKAIVGMASLVTKDIQDGDLCAGSPMRILKSNVTWTL